MLMTHNKVLAALSSSMYEYISLSVRPEFANKNVLQKFSVDMDKREEEILSMIGRGENLVKNGKTMQKAYVCRVCGKEGQRSTIKDHIEVNHLGISIPCNICEQTFKSKTYLRWHNTHIHK